MLRNIFFYLCFLPATLVLSSLTVLAAVDKSGWAAHKVGLAWGRTTAFLTGMKLDVDLKTLDTGRNYIFMVNHQSQVDIPVLYAALRAFRFGFVAKHSLFKIPLFGLAMKNAGHIPLDRTNRRRAMKSIDYAVNQAKEGWSIVIFPEGTRSTDFSTFLEFKIGGMIMALKCGLPVVPLVVTGTGHMLPRGKMLLKPGKVRVKALIPIETQGKYTLKQREQFKQDLYAVMHAAYLEMIND